MHQSCLESAFRRVQKNRGAFGVDLRGEKKPESKNLHQGLFFLRNFLSWISRSLVNNLN